MWIFTKYGFYSVACADVPGSHSIDPDVVMVCSRVKRHLLNLLEKFAGTGIANAKIEASEATDYKYRIIVPKPVWVTAIA